MIARRGPGRPRVAPPRPAPPVPPSVRGPRLSVELWQVHRPPANPDDDLVEGSIIVAEVGANAGLLLWRALRDVRQWAAVPACMRPFVFPPAAGQARREALRRACVNEALWAPLCVAALLVDEPVNADPGRLLHACRRIAHWCAAEEAPVTAAAFDACAAALLPIASASV